MLNHAAIAITRGLLRQRNPLVHNLTSAVVANFTANVLLAIGASPAMVESEDEVVAFAAATDALVINLGSLTPQRGAVMRLAAISASTAGTPWILDPVGAGAIGPRTEFARALALLRPTAIRGNASEIVSLAGGPASGRGIDSGAASDAATGAAMRLARDTGAIVAVTGQVDYVADGDRLQAFVQGHPLMAAVTGMGCAATAIIAACLAVHASPVEAVAQGLSISAQAGEAAARLAAGPGSFQALYLDALAGPG